MNTSHSRSSQFYKAQSLLTDNQPSEPYQLNKQALEQNLHNQRISYMEQKQQEIEEAKRKKMNEIKEKKIIQSQGSLKHNQRFQSMQISQPYLAQPLFVEPERDNKEPLKIPFIPLKQRIYSSKQSRQSSQAPWLSQSPNPIEIFDMNQILKPTPQQQKQLHEKEQLNSQKFDYQNFKLMMKNKNNNLTEPQTNKSSNLDDNKNKGYFQNTVEEQEKNSNLYQLSRSNTLNSGLRAISHQKSLHSEKQNFPYLINGYSGETPSSITTKRSQTPLNEFKGQYQNKSDFIKLDTHIDSPNHKLQNVNSPFSRLQSANSRSPINKTIGEFNKNSQSQDKIKCNFQNQQTLSSSNTNGNSSGDKSPSIWKYSYNTKMNIFQPSPIDIYNVKTSNSTKQANLIFKPNGNLGNLFSNYSSKNQEQNNRKRGFSAANRVQTAS